MKSRTAGSLSILVIAFLAFLAVLAAGCRRQSISGEVEAAQVPEGAGATVEAAVDEDASEAQVAALEARRAELDERARKLAADEEAVAERERTLRRREAQVDRRLEDMDARLRSVETAPAAEPLPEEAAPPVGTVITRNPVEPATFRLSVPEGTVMTVELIDALSSRQSRAGDTFRASVSEDVVVNGEVAVAAGSVVRGRVVDAVAAKRIGGQAKLALSFTDLEPLGGRSTAIEAEFALAGKKTTKKDAATIGGAAAGGAILGRVIDGDGKGGVVGAILGAAAGTAIAASDRDDVELPPGTAFELRLQRPVFIVLDQR